MFPGDGGMGGPGGHGGMSKNSDGSIVISGGTLNINSSGDGIDANGKTVITHKPELDFALVILSTPDIKSGENYTLTVGSVSEAFTAN